MDEFTWYSRLLVWVGALVLLVQSITGHGLGIVTVLAVIAVSGGFLAFLAGLSVPALTQRLSAAGSREAQAVGRPAASAPLAQPTSDVGSAAEPGPPPSMEDERIPEEAQTPTAGGATSAPAPAAGTAQALGTPPVAERGAAAEGQKDAAPVTANEKANAGAPARHPTVELAEGDDRIGSVCPRCTHALAAGEVAVTCLVCGTVQHAACWTAKHFHCSTAGCTGRGSLEAPE